VPLWPLGQVTPCTARSGRLAGHLTGHALGHGAWLIQVQLERGGLRVLAQAEPRMTS